MSTQKPILSVEEQISHLEANGVTFDIMSKDAAKEYLINNNNYFKLTAYRKNYDKHPGGANVGKYIRLDFAYLVDLAIIDMKLRYQIMLMALDIEHHAKLKILHEIENRKDEDGYQIVKDYIASLPDTMQHNLNAEISRNRGNVYCGEIIEKYDGNYPVWAFLEIIPFGRLIGFYQFCGKRFNDKEMEQDFYRLLACRDIRNASAHNNCILNDLHSGNTRRITSAPVDEALMEIPKMSKKFRSLKMSNARIQQFVTLLYVHKTMVKSDGLNRTTAERLNTLTERMYKHKEYYNSNALVLGTFNFLKLVVDKWYPIA